MIILDTNVVSELMRPAPSARVVDWVGAHHATELCTTSITQAEILYGLTLLPKGRRRSALEAAAMSMFKEEFGDRILGFGSDVAPAYARIASERRHAGRPISHFDAQIAAIALTTGAVVATRNTSDFARCGVTLVDPWSA